MKLVQQIWKDILPDVTDEFQRTFKQLPTHAEKLRLVGNLMEEHNQLECIKHCTDERKDDAKAAAYRLQGNEVMQSEEGPRRKLIAAAEYYNKALAHAQANSIEMAKAYGNRSAVCHALQEYSLALDNIEMAFSKGACDEKLGNRLNARKDACRKMLLQMPERKPLYREATFEGSPRIPRVAEGIILRQDQRQGRHLVATRDFAVGDILMIDEPYSVVWSVEGTSQTATEDYKRCHHCLRMRPLQLQPCPNCVAIMFCSEECATAAMPYHRMECKILHKLWEVHDRFLMNPLQIVSMAIHAFDDDLESLETHIQQIDPNFTAFDLDWTSINPQQLYDTIHVLSTNERKRTPMHNIAIAVRSYLLGETFIRHSAELNRLATDEKKRDLIRSLILHHSMSAYVNMRFTNLDNGLAAFPLLSLINHSCLANTTCLPIAGSRKAIIVHRPIKAGQQITYSYSVLCSADTKAARQQTLRQSYQFDCRCEACLTDYPIVPVAILGYNASYMPEDCNSMDAIEDVLDATEGQSAERKASLLEPLNALMAKYQHLQARKDIRRLVSIWKDCHSWLYNEPTLERKYNKLSSF